MTTEQETWLYHGKTADWGLRGYQVFILFLSISHLLLFQHIGFILLSHYRLSCYKWFLIVASARKKLTLLVSNKKISVWVSCPFVFWQ